ncbi:MAG: VanW family protein [Actinomycetota bacterium]|nr:VanW family protein [Actinomycetota bacterium]
MLWQRVAILAALAALAGMALGLAFAGSPSRLANGVRIAGVDVGGRTPSQARSILERRAGALASVPVTFRVGLRTWQLQPRHLGVRVDWSAAVDAVRRQGNGFGPLRGFRRLDLRFFGADVAPPTQVYGAALEAKLNQISAAVNVEHREASIVLRGLRPETVASRTGHLLDRHAAAATIVRALASLTREPVGLPIQLDRPKVTASDLRVAQAQVRTALSANLHLTLGATRWNLRPPRIARVLQLPADGRRDLRIAGAGASSWFTALAKRVDKPPVDADWAVSKSGIRVIPDRTGYVLDVPRSAKAVLRAALVTEPSLRSAKLTVERVGADRTAAEARAMNIKGLVASYQTLYGGDPNRIHNVQLVSHLVDKHVIAPGETFSFNGATGERSEDKGFLEAPVIINGELKTGLGGGVCQVSTTVFNAAYEAGLPIVSRTNHALYISHYPQGRDATVNYPDTDLKFTNDTGHWLLLRTWVGSSSLTVALYGTPVHRRVVSETLPLVVTGPPPVRKIKDPSLFVGQTVVEEPGSSALSTSNERKVYDTDGKLLFDTRFYSSYRGEMKVIRVGTKPRPADETGTTTTGTTTTTTTTKKTTTTTTTTTTPRP